MTFFHQWEVNQYDTNRGLISACLLGLTLWSVPTTMLEIQSTYMEEN